MRHSVPGSTRASRVVAGALAGHVFACDRLDIKHTRSKLDKGLILKAVPDILLGQDRQKPFQLMFTWQMHRQPSDEAAISPEPGAAIALCRECKVFASNNFRKPLHCFVPIHCNSDSGGRLRNSS
jgi:hypothetical protein